MSQKQAGEPLDKATWAYEAKAKRKARKQERRALKQQKLDNRIRAIVREELDIAHEATLALREED